MVPAAYRPVLANRVFRRLTAGFAVSYLGDGMSFVAAAWPVTVALGVAACVLLVGRRQQWHLVRSSQSAHEELGR